MKAISLRQPWAWAVIHAGKDIENRPWRSSYRGPILIHAAKCMTGEEYEDGLETILRVTGGHFGLASDPLSAVPKLEDMPRGGIVGQAEIVDCISASDSPWFFGPHAFVLRNVRALPFRPLKGALGFFEVPDA